MISVIFDCDGILLDSMGVWHQLDDKLAKRAGVVFSKQDKDFLTAGTIEECARYMHEKFGLGNSTEHVVQMIRDDMMDYYKHEAAPKPGAIEFVKTLHEAGIPMAVASSTPPHLLHAGLEATGFAPYMKAIYSVDDFGTSKREPLVYDKAREACGTPRKHTWVFEDSTYALQTLAPTGFQTCGVFDNDISGTRADLQQNASLFIDGFTTIPPKELLQKLLEMSLR